VGGSTGHVSIELATHNPQLSFIIQDFETLRPQFDAIVPEALKPRLQFQAHDFFTPQPVKGASVYFLKTILHDWPDHLCVKIIQNIVSAMKSESRIIAMDGVMPEPGTVPIPIMKLNTSMDLQMMTALNAKERTRKDWEGLFRLADKRLQIVAFRQPEGGMASMIEVVFHDIQK
jgi:6-hydroxytryprostatin B O-methyltransferase